MKISVASYQYTHASRCQSMSGKRQESLNQNQVFDVIRHLSSTPAVTIVTATLQVPIQGFRTRWSRCPPVATSRKHSPSSIPLRRRWYLHRLSTFCQCPQLLNSYSTTTHHAGFHRTLRRRNNFHNYFQVGTWRKHDRGCSVGWNCT